MAPRLPAISKGLVRLWLVLSVAAAGSLADVAEFATRQPGFFWAVAGLICLSFLKATALTAIFAVCRSNRWLKGMAIALIAAFLCLSLLNGFCWLFYRFGISMKLFKIIVETNPAEVGEFMPELGAKLLAMIQSIWFWISVAAFAAAWKYLPKIKGKWLAIGSCTLSFFGLIYLIVVFSTAEFGRNTHSVFLRSCRCVAKYIHDQGIIRQLQSQKRPIANQESLESSYNASRIVVVIGESASRDHLSLYGYPLPTSPRLDSIQSNLYVFTDAVASSTSTAENMPRLLTLMTDELSDKEWYDFPSVIQMFRNIGYKTYWISNQEYSGQWSNISSILSADADVVKYVGSMDSEDHYLIPYDDVLLPEWHKTLASGDSLHLTFLHLMGSHFQYANRFPADRRKFTAEDILSRVPREWLDKKKAAIVADYDNSILLTDSILSIVIEDVRNSHVPTVLLYLSDHGEDVYDDRDYRGRDSKFVDVPFMIYVNDSYRSKNPGIVKEIEKARSVSFSTSELPQILMHLSGTSYSMYDSVRDPLSPAFMHRIRYVDNEPYYKDH